jgi:hypothetical protein
MLSSRKRRSGRVAADVKELSGGMGIESVLCMRDSGCAGSVPDCVKLSRAVVAAEAE